MDLGSKFGTHLDGRTDLAGKDTNPDPLLSLFAFFFFFLLRAGRFFRLGCVEVPVHIWLWVKTNGTILG